MTFPSVSETEKMRAEATASGVANMALPETGGERGAPRAARYCLVRRLGGRFERQAEFVCDGRGGPGGGEGTMGVGRSFRCRCALARHWTRCATSWSSCRPSRRSSYSNRTWMPPLETPASTAKASTLARWSCRRGATAASRRVGCSEPMANAGAAAAETTRQRATGVH
jgi:hypothetical protein